MPRAEGATNHMQLELVGMRECYLVDRRPVPVFAFSSVLKSYDVLNKLTLYSAAYPVHITNLLIQPASLALATTFTRYNT